MDAYTSGEWHVKQGRDDEFVQAWREFAEASGQDYASNPWAMLLRDTQKPGHFRSIALWGDPGEIAAWRQSDGFRQGTAKLAEFVDEIELDQFEVAVGVGELPRATSMTAQR